MKFVLATQNMKKLEELKKVLSDLGVEVVSEAELGVKVEVDLCRELSAQGEGRDGGDGASFHRRRFGSVR